MKVMIENARLIEDGKVVGVPIWIRDKARNKEAFSTEAAHKQIEALRAELLNRVLEERREFDFLKEGAVYTIDFTYRVIE